MCLRLFIRSKQSYLELRQADVLGVLPHPKTLTLYKNSVEQKSGLNDDLLSWMKQVALDKGLWPESMSVIDGTLVFDEMAIAVSILLD